MFKKKEETFVKTAFKYYHNICLLGAKSTEMRDNWILLHNIFVVNSLFLTVSHNLPSFLKLSFDNVAVM